MFFVMRDQAGTSKSDGKRDGRAPLEDLSNRAVRKGDKFYTLPTPAALKDHSATATTTNSGHISSVFGHNGDLNACHGICIILINML